MDMTVRFGWGWCCSQKGCWRERPCLRDGTSRVMIRDLQCIVEELMCSYVSHETLVELRSIPSYFPLPPPSMARWRPSGSGGQLETWTLRTSPAIKESSRMDLGLPVAAQSGLLHQTLFQQLRSRERRMRIS